MDGKIPNYMQIVGPEKRTHDINFSRDEDTRIYHRARHVVQHYWQYTQDTDVSAFALPIFLRAKTRSDYISFHSTCFLFTLNSLCLLNNFAYKFFIEW